MTRLTSSCVLKSYHGIGYQLNLRWHVASMTPASTMSFTTPTIVIPSSTNRNNDRHVVRRTISGVGGRNSDMLLHPHLHTRGQPWSFVDHTRLPVSALSCPIAAKKSRRRSRKSEAAGTERRLQLFPLQARPAVHLRANRSTLDLSPPHPTRLAPTSHSYALHCRAHLYNIWLAEVEMIFGGNRPHVRLGTPWWQPCWSCGREEGHDVVE